MIHLFIFNNKSRAANYGIGTYVRQLTDGIRALQNAQIKVSFVDLYADVKEYSITNDERGLLHYQIPALYPGMENETFCRCAFYFLARHIKKEKGVQLVFHFNYFQHLPLAVLLKGQYIDCRILLTVHYLSWCFDLKGNKTVFRQIAAKGYRPQNEKEKNVLESIKQEREFLHLVDEIIVLSKDTNSILVKNYYVSECKIHLIYNGLGEELCLDEKKGIKKRMILFVGRLDEIKGVNFLINAFQKIAPKYPDTHLIIIGDGNFQEYLPLSQGLMGRISFWGRMSKDKIEGIYKSAYIGVMPSFHEQCSYTAIEMMRHCIPIIGTDSTGLAEMFDLTPELCVHIDENNMIDQDFIEQIFSRIDLLLSNNEVYMRAADAFGKLYNTRYKVSSMVDGTLNAIKVSLNRQNYTISGDYLKHIDTCLIRLINKHPDIDLDFYGITGIGVYLWKRVLDLSKEGKDLYHIAFIQEHLIYFLDWVSELTNDSELFPNEMLALFQDMKRTGFYITCVEKLLNIQSVSDVALNIPSDRTIIQNALKICNCKI